MEKIVYLDIKFWDRFDNSFPNYITFTDSSISKMENYISLYRFIMSSPLLKFNISYQDMIERVKTNDKLKMLWKKSTEGHCKVTFNADIPYDKQINTAEDLNAIYLLGDENYRTRLDKFGVITITPDSINEIGYLFKDNGKLIKKGEKVNWNFLSDYKHRFNAILIVDSYIVKDTTLFENNIFKILDILLPQEIEATFDISIVSKDFTQNREIIRYEKLNEHIKQIRPKLKYNMTLYRDQDIHDRLILTNNMLIECGAGFNLLNENGIAKHSTRIAISYPFFCNYSTTIKELYNKTIIQTKKLHKNNIDSIYKPEEKPRPHYNCWGDGIKNRLLE